MGSGAMRERFWLMLGVILVLIVVGFASLVTRGSATHGQDRRLADQMAALPGKLFANLRDMTRNFADSLSGLPQNSSPVTAAEATHAQPQPPAKQ
jgi:hypothetical protein